MKEPFRLYRRCEKNGRAARCPAWPACACDRDDRPTRPYGRRPAVAAHTAGDVEGVGDRLALKGRQDAQQIAAGLVAVPKAPAPRLRAAIAAYLATPAVQAQATRAKLATTWRTSSPWSAIARRRDPTAHDPRVARGPTAAALQKDRRHRVAQHRAARLQQRQGVLRLRRRRSGARDEPLRGAARLERETRPAAALGARRAVADRRAAARLRLAAQDRVSLRLPGAERSR